ncbi:MULTISPECIES: oligosaccharide flippase family protein [unclassified Bacillus (in: firmicutes)]|uniref:oligosaccharide flippase family protein n=1 Tax=unclassified Bacillus (in: firmicutes) TaxID=185979 RepID=UPI0030F6CB0D
MKINQRKAGVLLSYALTGTNALVGFIYIPILLYFLGKDEYGLYQLMGSFLVYLGLFDFGLSNTVTRYYSKYIALKDEKAKENVLAISTVIYILLTMILVVVGIILYFYLDEIFNNALTPSEIASAEKIYIIILITTVITISTSVFNAIITANEQFMFLKGLSIIQTIMRPIIVFAVFSIEASALIVVIIQALINVLGIVLKIYYSLKKLQVKVKLHYWDMPLLKEMFRYSFFIFITALMDQIFWRSDQVILGIIVGTSSVAVYSIGSQIIMNYMTLSTAMSGVFLPSITKKVTENVSNDELTDIFIKLGRLQYIILGAVLTGFIMFGKEFIYIWVGDSFSEAYYITLIIMVPFTIDLIQNIGLTILQAKNMYSFRASVFFVMSLLNIVFSIPLAIHYGGIGAAVATSTSYLIGNGLIMNIYYYKKVKLNIIKFWKEMIKISIPLVITCIFGIFINEINFNSQILSFLLKLMLYVVTYILVMWILGLNKYEKELILVPLKNLRRQKN